MIIPTFNAGPSLRNLLAQLLEKRPRTSIILADGGSTDETLQLASQFDVDLIPCDKGRGAQLRQACTSVSKDWLLILHADSRLPDNWRSIIAQYIGKPGAKEKAAYFSFKLDDKGFWPALLEKIVALRCRFFALPYGDQALLISRQLYEETGGYRALPFMEDLDLIRRLGRKRLYCLPASLTTSAQKYRDQGYVWRSSKNFLLLLFRLIGISEHRLARITWLR